MTLAEHKRSPTVDTLDALLHREDVSAVGLYLL